MLIYTRVTVKAGLSTPDWTRGPDHGLKLGLVTDAQLHVDYLPLRTIT